ncbi:DUF3105 domain-containing protein [Pseudonocardia sp. CA-107938]|uniref:DUF3105 domain-containing protein n=1 Tax=Pseudonocardia sp. CA-107938 TaxID=3240021 RepID=UPI003D8E6923
MRRPVRSAAVVLAGALLLSGCSSLPFGGASAAPIRQSVDTSAFVPSADNPDPSKKIKGITIQKYAGALHVGGDVRVAYTHTPPFGGRHDQVWAACNGVVYTKPVRSENLVHSTEHGAIWIAYDPARIQGGDVAALAALVEGKPYMVMSPFPDMPSPISLQSWGHQLAVDSVTDPRIDQFITALRVNPNTHPEPNASCDMSSKYFDQDNPPPYVAPPGVKEVDGKKIVKES